MIGHDCIVNGQAMHIQDTNCIAGTVLAGIPDNNGIVWEPVWIPIERVNMEIKDKRDLAETLDMRFYLKNGEIIGTYYEGHDLLDILDQFQSGQKFITTADSMVLASEVAGVQWGYR